MATVKPEAPAPTSAPAMTPGNPNLDTLQGMLNMVLLTAGRFIKEHQAGGGTGRMKQGLQRAVPVASERFHDALDELENEVRLAQTVLRRDLALLKQDRLKREAAAKQHEAERVRLAAESRNAPAKQDEAVVKPEATTPAVQPEAPPQPPPAELLRKIDTPEAPLKIEEAPAQPSATDTTTAPPADPLFDATPTDSNHQEQEFDFDFEFGDAMDTTGGNSNNNESGDMMDTSGDLDFTLDEGPSLLRGLEDFANAKSNDDDNKTAGASADLDFTMPDLPDLNTDAKPPAEQPKPAEPIQQDTKQSDSVKDSKPVEEAADSKPAVDTNSTANIDEPMETMTTDNLEDLFNLDDYDNPEGGDSAFNDAFFDFN
ncbi:hypothetical protein E8E13_011208 [Curvularia kusanoi]|uniref:Uncharacterized protein n=1 Tax=Curvularia kusanoi TaxID=90978 RepID=A0A9P4TP33_CURKU|nr:hypothetical protein E8E13_011208 [Curvularia kusanoi]